MSSVGTRLSRVETNETFTVCPPPPMLTVDFSRSSSSLICCNERFVVPRRSIAAVSSVTVARPVNEFRSPRRSTMFAVTAPPRVDLARKLYFAPPGSVSLRVRASMLAGEGSKASACLSMARPVYPASITAGASAAGIVARTGAASGTNKPVVRFEGLRYAMATRLTSAAVTFSRRSRDRNHSRQSPFETYSESPSPTRSLLL